MRTKVFDTSWEDDVPRAYRRRHGTHWTPEDKTLLRRAFEAGCTLREICAQTQRTKDGVVYGLKCLQAIHRGTDGLYYYGERHDGVRLTPKTEPPLTATYVHDSVCIQGKHYDRIIVDELHPITGCASAPPPPQTLNSSHIPMNTTATQLIAPINEASFKVEQRTYIGGVNAADLSDHAIYNKIAEIEAHADALKNIKNKPESLQTYLLKLLAMSLALGQYVDSRNTK